MIVKPMIKEQHSALNEISQNLIHEEGVFSPTEGLGQHTEKWDRRQSPMSLCFTAILAFMAQSRSQCHYKYQ